jgi:hypothetical protein
MSRNCIFARTTAVEYLGSVCLKLSRINHCMLTNHDSERDFRLVRVISKRPPTTPSIIVLDAAFDIPRPLSLALATLRVPSCA